MSNTFETYCANCDKGVCAHVRHADDRLKVRGETIEYSAVLLECPECGAEISDSRIEEGNLDCAYEIYRDEHSIPSACEIAKLRKEYGLSLREFSKFLGFGEQTVARYERGSLPDDVHAFALRQAQTAEGAMKLLDSNRNKLAKGSISKIIRFVESNQGTRNDYALMGIDLSTLESRDPGKACLANGYRPFDFQRAAALAQLLAEKCHELYKTKLQKALHFADMLACERIGRSLTGMQYAHADFGPIVDGMDELLWRLKGTDVLESSECGWGEVLKPGKEIVKGDFSDEEVAIIDDIVAFVNSFSTANELSEYSHSLTAWANTDNGQHIDYNAKPGEIGDAVYGRLGQKTRYIR